MKNKLQAKDLITVGIFSAIYFVVFFASGMLGYVPLLFVLMPIYFPIFTAIPFMLFLTKTKKFGMVTIMSLICGFLMFATGHTWLPLVTSITCGLLADLILKYGRYESSKCSALGYGVFSIWPIGAMLPLWVMRASYLEYIEGAMGAVYADAVSKITPNWLPFAFVPVVFLSGLIGSFFGKKVLKKHFVRAGIV